MRHDRSQCKNHWRFTGRQEVRHHSIRRDRRLFEIRKTSLQRIRRPIRLPVGKEGWEHGQRAIGRVFAVKDRIGSCWKPESASKRKKLFSPQSPLNTPSDVSELMDPPPKVTERMQKGGWREHTRVACRKKRGRREHDVHPRHPHLFGDDWRGIEKFPYDEQIGPFGQRTKVSVCIRDFGKSNLPQQPFRTTPHVEIIS